jgi:hypothetical protein
MAQKLHVAFAHAHFAGIHARARHPSDLSKSEFYPRFAESIPMPIPVTITVEVKTALTPFPIDAHSQVVIIVRIEALQATNAFAAYFATHFRHWFNPVGLSTWHAERA